MLEVVNTPRPPNLLITPEKNTLSESLQGLQPKVNNSEKKTALLIAKSNSITGRFYDQNVKTTFPRKKFTVMQSFFAGIKVIGIFAVPFPRYLLWATENGD
ncbi:MAG: hypothetical protein ACRCYO_18075 [Bacteroidia bacterium]